MGRRPKTARFAILAEAMVGGGDVIPNMTHGTMILDGHRACSTEINGRYRLGDGGGLDGRGEAPISLIPGCTRDTSHPG